MGIAALAIGSRETLDATKRKPTSACGTFMVHSYVIAYVACTELGRFVSTRYALFRCFDRTARCASETYGYPIPPAADFEPD